MTDMPKNQVSWMLIPKGIDNNQFKFSIVAIIDQCEFQPQHNWTRHVKENLTAFNLKIENNEIPNEIPIEVEIDTGRLVPSLWEIFFNEPNKTVDENRRASEKWLEWQQNRESVTQLSDTTFDVIDASLQITAANYVAHIYAARKRLGNGLYPHSPIKINELFQYDAKKCYQQLSSFFLPPKPSFESQINALKAKNKLNNEKSTDLTRDFINQVVKNIEKSAGRNVNDKDSNPVCSESAIESLLEGYRNLINGVKSKSLLGLTSQHVLTTFPYIPSGEKSEDEIDHDNPHNKLAMLMSEPGLLCSFGIVFNCQKEFTLPEGDSLISVQAKWKDGRKDSEFSTPTLTSSEGFAVSIDPNESVFDNRGYLKLGSADKFKIADFRPEVTFKKHMLAAQSDRNKLPEFSPGTGYFNMPDFEFVDFSTDDVGLYWSGSSRKSQKELISNKSGNPSLSCPSCLYLEDLVVGVRPYWGHVDDKHQITWFNLAAKKVEYNKKTESQLKRSPEDIERDNSIVFLEVNSQSNDTHEVTFDVISKTYGWGVGLNLPGESKVEIKKIFDKRESPHPTKRYPAQRFGNSMCMAAALVFRDGSSNSDEKVKSDLGVKWNDMGNVLIAGDSFDKTQPFRLSRWERLKSPILLHNNPPLSGWWPKETVENIVVATSGNNQFRSQSTSSRYLVPDRLEAIQIWKHGCFDKSSPKKSAFRNVKMEKDGNFLVDKDSGESMLKFVSPRGDNEGPFYHPDPLVESFVLKLVRRNLPRSNQIHDIKIKDKVIEEKSFNIYRLNKWPTAEPLKIEVKAINRHSMSDSPLRLTGNILEILVPEGEEFSLLVIPTSSKSNLNKMHGFGPEKLKNLIQKFNNSEPAILFNHFSNNEIDLNPTITNSRIIDIHHISLKPMLWPSCTICLSDNNRLNSTMQELKSDHEIDIGSTSALELYSTWNEPQGNLLELINGAKTKVSRSALVGKLDFDQIVTKIPDEKKTQLLRDALIFKDNSFTQDFKDFKHRKVAYWATAISKAGHNTELKPDDYSLPAFSAGNKLALKALEKDSKVDKNISVVHVLASKRPPPPNIRYLLPSFRFDTERLNQKIRRARKSILSVHMDGDWYMSGEDEQLAIILLNDPSGSYGNTRKKYNEYASFWGADPIRQSSRSMSRLPDYIGKEHFAGKQRFENYELDKQYKLSLLLLKPEICQESMSWRIEIPIINPSAVSKPFVRFAFARYQKYALEELKLSNIVTADYIQLSDSREVVIFRDPQQPDFIDLTIYGPFADDSDSVNFIMRAWLEYKFDHFTDDSSSTWIQDGTYPIIEMLRIIRDGQACWYCKLEAKKGISDLRVALVEVEKYKISKDSEDMGERPIYFDVVPLSNLG